MDELREAIEALRNLDGVTPEQIADGLREHAGGVFQVVFNRGHGAATADKRTEIDGLTTKVADLTGKLTAATTRVAELEQGDPDHKAELERLRTTVTDLQGKLTEAKDTHTKAIRDMRINDGAGRLRNLLVDHFKVDPDKADVLVEKHRKRIRTGGEDDTRIVVMQDGLDVPVQADDPVKHLATELTNGLDPRWITSTADGGSGARGTGATSDDNKFVDEVRERFRKERESQPNPLIPKPTESATV
jgi:hypothetical protein